MREAQGQRTTVAGGHRDPAECSWGHSWLGQAGLGTPFLLLVLHQCWLGLRPREGGSPTEMAKSGAKSALHTANHESCKGKALGPSSCPLTSVKASVPSFVQYGQGLMSVPTTGGMDVYLKDLPRPTQVLACSPALSERAEPDAILLRLLEFPVPVAGGTELAEEMWRETGWM